MGVIHVPPPIVFIAYGVLPKPALPNQTLVTGIGGGVDLARGGFFDFPPARGKIAIAIGHGPDAMQMIGQYHHGVDVKWPGLHGLANGLSEYFDALFVDKYWGSMPGDDGEEIAGARLIGAAIIAHVLVLVDALRLSILLDRF